VDGNIRHAAQQMGAQARRRLPRGLGTVPRRHPTCEKGIRFGLSRPHLARHNGLKRFIGITAHGILLNYSSEISKPFDRIISKFEKWPDYPILII
jgi:hypothetical protein